MIVLSHLLLTLNQVQQAGICLSQVTKAVPAACYKHYLVVLGLSVQVMEILTCC